MGATLEIRGKTYQVDTPQSVREALLLLKMDAESYLVMRHGEIIDPEEILQDGDLVHLIPVIAGG